MSGLRALGLVALVIAGLALGAVLFTHSLHDLHSKSATTTAIGATHHRAGARRGRGTRAARRRTHPSASPHRHGHPRTARSASTGPRPRQPSRQRHATQTPLGLHLPGGSLLLLVGLEILGGVLIVTATAGVLIARRWRQRSRRHYELYELHLSAHDEAKPQDLQDMVEAIANIVRVFPGDRMRDGQPYLALELICGHAHQGMEWSLNLRCEPRTVRALDAAISATYPDVRIGHRHDDPPLPRPGRLREPGFVMRFRKERSFIYPLLAAGEELASPPVEQIARAQIELGEPSIVRFGLTPTPTFFEEYARRLYKRHENKLVRQERWGLPEGGLWSTLNRAEMTDAQRTQNRSLFWLETVVAADTIQACKTVAAAVQSRRGENRLHRRWMYLRQGLYRRRFAQGLGPPIPSIRNLVSAAEVSHLIELPTARMKGVPVRRQMLPRIPAPADCQRCARAVLTETTEQALVTSARDTERAVRASGPMSTASMN